ncbi:hypothetical protein ACIQFU_05785 [Streptomyces sp. NPDC093065]
MPVLSSGSNDNDGVLPKKTAAGRESHRRSAVIRTTSAMIM